MKQTGYIHEVRDTDYVMGESSPLPATQNNPSGDWTQYTPGGEKQNKDYAFDTLSCTTFSALNIIETWIKWLEKTGRLTDVQREALDEFYIDREFNISDRFTAIMSGTTKQGNSFQKVWDSIRKHGILPERYLRFGGDTWEEYHDPSVITQEMKDKALQFKKLFEFGYSWVDVSKLQDYLKSAPIHIAIPQRASHAVEYIADKKIFNTYNPFIQDYTGDIAYASLPFLYIYDIKKVPEEIEQPQNETRELYKPKNFALYELVSKKVYDEFGDRAWQFLDERVLRNIQAIREYYGVSVRVNDWKWGGDFHYSGFDEGGFRKDGTSQHNMGRALDFNVRGVSAEKVRSDISSGKIKLPYPDVWLEKDVDWVHMDVRYSDKKGAYQFNA